MAWNRRRLTSLELCAGAGGQALGLERAGFSHKALVEYEPPACETLRLNRPQWNTIEGDVRQFDGTAFRGVDLVAGGVPCPPFSKAGKQLGADDERDLFPDALRIVREAEPRAVLLENVRGLLDPQFDGYRDRIEDELTGMGFAVFWRLHHASDFGVPQLRPRTILVAVRDEFAERFTWPEVLSVDPVSVGEALGDLMASGGWKGAADWAAKADRIGPTLVGGSKKHGGPDLGPTRSKRAWAELGVDGLGIANEVPGPDFEGMPRLTVEMAAAIQGFPPDWQFAGKKTAAYRQIGNAFPPPVAAAVGSSIRAALLERRTVKAVSRPQIELAPAPASPQTSIRLGRVAIQVPPSPGPSARSANMRAIRRKDTKPERAVRSLLFGAGCRYRVDLPVRPDAGRLIRPDIAFPRHRVAIFIDGCFWHGCPEHGRRSGGSNAGYWVPKIARNRERDVEQRERLEGDGWTVLRFWEHDDPESIATDIRVALNRV